MIDLSTGRPFSRRDACKGLAAIIAAGCAPSIVLAASSSAGSIGGLRRMLGVHTGMLKGDSMKVVTMDFTASDAEIVKQNLNRIIGSGSRDILIMLKKTVSGTYPDAQLIAAFGRRINGNNIGGIRNRGSSAGSFIFASSWDLRVSKGDEYYFIDITQMLPY